MNLLTPPHWGLQHQSADPMKALFPQNGAPPDLAEYVRLSFGQDNATLASGIRPYASGNRVHVGPGQLKEVPDGTTVTVSEACKWSYSWYIFLHVPSRQLAVAGLALALVAS
jgi:hypothetical protein